MLELLGLQGVRPEGTEGASRNWQSGLRSGGVCLLCWMVLGGRGGAGGGLPCGVSVLKSCSRLLEELTGLAEVLLCV